VRIKLPFYRRYSRFIIEEKYIEAGSAVRVEPNIW
jgi:hypothetical protein